MDNNLMIIFGGTGDLTRRKLIPALYRLDQQQLLPERFALLALGRRDGDDTRYRDDMARFLTTELETSLDKKAWSRFASRVHYLSMNHQESEQYKKLKDRSDELAQQYETGPNRLFYLAVAPRYFEQIIHCLQESEMSGSTEGWQRLLIEKPFGSSLADAEKLNRTITGVFPEESVFRIDHYLGKEMIQNLTVFRFQNTLFEPVWHHRFIDHVQILSSEKEGVGLRGSYYDHSGALRDMVQNHLLQMLAITAMEPPLRSEAAVIRSEKVKMLESLQPFHPVKDQHRIVIGQYEGYHRERDVAPDSVTETFAALQLELDHPSWRGVPFYLMTGKKMKEKRAQVTIQFRSPHSLSWGTKDNLEPTVRPNVLQVRIQPDEGVYLRINTKRPGVENQVVQADMEYCQSCQYGYNSPEAYEKLLLDAIRGDATRFTHWNELAAAWRFTDSVRSCLDNRKQRELHRYPEGSRGPAAAADLLEEKGRKWFLTGFGGD